MPKLHEVIAVRSNLNGQGDKALGGVKDLFDKKKHHFGSKLVTFIPKAEGEPTKTEEQSDIQTTVVKELNWFSNIFAKAIDNTYQIDLTNMEAKADVVLEDQTDPLLKSVPATTLLALEGYLEKVHELLNHVPTLDPAKAFTPDSQKGPGYYIARPTETNRTKKTKKNHVLAEATDKHPAQVHMYEEDVPIGTLQTQEWSTLITPAQKAELLNRCDMLERAIRRARARANEAEVNTTAKIGNRLLEYIFTEVKS